MKAYDLQLGDCLELMRDLPDASVDLILCDLPYGTTTCRWDSVIPFHELWEGYCRVIRGHGAIVLTAQQPFTTALIASNLAMFKYAMVWRKNRPSGFAQAKNKPLVAHEDVCVFSTGVTVHASQSKKRMPYNPQGLVRVDRVMSNSASDRSTAFQKRANRAAEYTQEFTGYPRSVLDFDSVDGAVHPTQKPVTLMEYLIRTYTNAGDTVLDNCMGSGTTGVACMNTGRRFIGMEQLPEYLDIATTRIEAAAFGAANENASPVVDDWLTWREMMLG